MASWPNRYVYLRRAAECLPLFLEAGDHLLGIHPELHDLKRDLSTDRGRLLGEPHLAHPPQALS